MQLKYKTEDRSMNCLKKICKINLILLGIDANKFISENKNVLYDCQQKAIIIYFGYDLG